MGVREGVSELDGVTAEVGVPVPEPVLVPDCVGEEVPVPEPVLSEKKKEDKGMCVRASVR